MQETIAVVELWACNPLLYDARSMVQCTTHYGMTQGYVLHMPRTLMSDNDIFGERYGTLRNFITGMMERNNHTEYRISKISLTFKQ